MSVGGKKAMMKKFSRVSLGMGNQVSSQGLWVICQLESQDSRMSRDGVLWENPAWAGRPADSEEVTFYDLSGAISVSCGRHKRC